jgi:hypothetical protein
VGEVCALANKVLVQKGEPLPLKERRVGAILTALGFPGRGRGGNDGAYQVEFSGLVQDLIHRLVTIYGEWQVDLYDSYVPHVSRTFCRKYKRVSDADLKHYEEVIKPAEERRHREEEKNLEKRLQDARALCERGELDVFRKTPPGPGEAKRTQEKAYFPLGYRTTTTRRGPNCLKNAPNAECAGRFEH